MVNCCQLLSRHKVENLKNLDFMGFRGVVYWIERILGKDEVLGFDSRYQLYFTP